MESVDAREHVGVVPVLGLGVGGIRIKAVVGLDARGGRVGRSCGAYVDDSGERRTSIEHAGCAFDDLHLLHVFHREESPDRASGISGEQGQVVHQHLHAAACAKTVAASPADLRFGIHNHHPGGLLQGFVHIEGVLALYEPRLQHLHGYGELGNVLFKLARGDHR